MMRRYLSGCQGKDSKEIATYMSTSLNNTCRGLLKDILYFASYVMLTAAAANIAW